MDHQVEDVPPPLCPHGPTFLFTHEHEEIVRKYKKRKISKAALSIAPYYACSASRDHKFCTFRMDQSRWLALSGRQRAEQNDKKQAGPPAEEYAYLLNCSEDKTFAFCHDCCRILVNPLEGAGVPKQHRFDLHLTYRCQNVTPNHPKSYFTEPSKLARAATSNESQAQFFFADDVAPFIIDHVLIKHGYRKVVCIGCPSIHEQIIGKYPPEQLSSFLLDIDLRFRQFFPANQFAQFNMFNYFFFNDPVAEEYLRMFLQTDSNGDCSDTIILIDPPFGGRIEYLAETIRKIQVLMTNCHVVEGMPFPPLILFFPYFNEHWIKRAFEDQVKITDYIVHYSNHGKFRRRNNTNAGNANSSDNKNSNFTSSPVRVYTNIARSKFNLAVLNPLLKTDNDDRPFYHWCELCSRFVFRSNSHCVDCQECPARDATKPYGHCGTCGICVKSTWSHCPNCKRCHLAKMCPLTEGGEGE